MRIFAAARIAVAYAIVIAVVSAGFVVGTQTVQSAQALDSSTFDPGYIISDQKFFNSSSMSQADIQSFLQSQEATCAPVAGVPCLYNYSQSTLTVPGAVAVNPNNCAAYSGVASESASQIIFKVAQACNVNPQVLLVTLQKEQGLITAASPTASQYQRAMGYGCPDTAPCDSQYFGFYNQVFSAAWQFRQYTNFPSRRYQIGQISVAYNPNASCGSSVVNIRNQATANLYNYTPYQPDASALANLNGAGDGCSSYGNRNFWVYFNNWFGSPTGPINPFGSLDIVAAGPGTIRIAGWALDPDSAEAIQIAVYIDGNGTGITASLPRPDVAALYPANGSAHGFDSTLPELTIGVHNVCVYAINVGPGSNALLGCRTVSTPGGAPVGSYDVATGGVGSVYVAGWTYNPATSNSVLAAVYVDSTGYSLTADQQRPDVAAAYPGYGPAHGFSATLPATPGAHNVCAYGISVVGGGGNTFLGCKTVTALAPITEQGRSPFGSLDVATGTASGTATGIFVGGWAIDPDTAASIPMQVYVGPVPTAVNANLYRSDIATIYSQYGGNHGFSATIPEAPGPYNVCVYAINTVPGANTLLGCRVVTVPGPKSDLGRAPTGSFDVAWPATGGYYVAGWALDPDTAASIPVAIYLDGALTQLTANQSRTDVGALYPGYGDNHGFAAVIPGTSGTHQICAVAVNNGAGANTPLGCKNVTG